MKLLKRIISITIFCLLVTFVLRNNKIFYASSSNNYNESQFVLTIENYIENIEKDIKVEIYTSIPVYDSNDNIVQFNNDYYNSFNVANGVLIIDRISDYMLIKIDLSTLPIGYGINEKTCFIDKKMNSKQLSLHIISDCEINKSDNNIQVVFYAENQNKIYADYLIEESEIDDSYKIKTGNKSFFKNVNSTLNLNDEINYAIDTDIMETEVTVYNTKGITKAELKYKPSYSNVLSVKSSDDRFIVYYDGNTMTKSNAQMVVDAIVDIDEFFCGVNNGINFESPNTNSDNEYKIYLEPNLKNNYYTGLGCTHSGTTSGILGINKDRYSYTLLHYDLVSQKNDFSSASNQSFKNTLAHEYFHAIQWKAGCDMSNSSNKTTHWMTESFATMAGLYYFKSLSIYDDYVVNNYIKHVFGFISHSKKSIDDYSSDDMEAYDSFIFPLYLVKRFGFNVIKDIITTHGSSLNTFSIINDVLEAKGTTLNKVFKEFAVNNSYPNYNYNDILFSVYTKEWKRDRRYNDDYYESDDFFPNNISFDLPYLSSNYIYLKSTDCENYDAYVTIEFSNTDGMDLTSIRKTDSNDLYYYSYDISNTSITIPQYSFGYYICDELIFALSNSNISGPSVSISCDINIVHQEIMIEENTYTDLWDIHSPSYEGYYIFTPKTTDIYEFSLNTPVGGNDRYPDGCIQILDSNKHIMQKYDIEDFNNEAKNPNGVKRICVKLDANTEYYIKIKNCYYFNDATLYVKKIDYDIELTANDNYIAEDIDYVKNDKLYTLSPTINGRYTITFTNNGVLSNSFCYVVLLKHENTFTKIKTQVVDNDTNVVTCDVNFIVGRTYYIGYFGVNSNGCTFDLTIERLVSKNITLATDLNMNVTVGSEVLLNNGVCQGTNITQGYTRCIYIYGLSPSQSRLDYYWYSLDESKAIVSNYGTVTAVGSEEISTVKIMAVYKYDFSKIGILEFTIYPDTSNTIKKVYLTTDIRDGSNPSGTEVTENGGKPRETIIHSGYTRFICFQYNNPTDSIQDFIWTSSDNQIASVSQFGTIKAGNKKGIVEIIGVYKYNPNFVATLTIEVR